MIFSFLSAKWGTYSCWLGNLLKYILLFLKWHCHEGEFSPNRRLFFKTQKLESQGGSVLVGLTGWKLPSNKVTIKGEVGGHASEMSLFAKA
jgi:hypothetical protein